MLVLFKNGAKKIFHLLVVKNQSIRLNIKVQNSNNYATFPIVPYKLYNLESGPPTEASMDKDQALKYYEQMQMCRKIETTCHNAYLEKLIRGFLHLYSGQEACAVGMKDAMREEDNLIGAYRIHGVAYVMGITAKEILGELCGRHCGYERGKGGSAHFYKEKFFGGHGIVGAQIPVGAGIAFANKYKGTGGVCFTLYGDGAANQGQCFEAYNIAALWKLPCIFICENNGYAMGTSVQRHSAMIKMYQKGHYIPGVWIDGMDVLAVREACKWGIDYVLKNGPLVMEFATYRYYGHSISDSGKSYRTKEEVQEVRSQKDPISILKKKILDKNLATEDEIKKIDKKTTEEVKKALEEVRNSPEPPMDELVTDVYSVTTEPLIRNVLPWKPLTHKRVGKAINFK